jgi:transposase
MVASVLVAKYGWHLPLYRQAKMLASQGIELDRSTLAFWVGYAAAELMPLYERLKANLLASAKLAVDETPVPVLDPGRGQTKTGYFWAIARDDRPWGGTDPPAVVYTYAPGRGGEHLEKLLANYRGVVQCDGYAPYKKLPADRITVAFCWSHLRREFFEIAERGDAPIATEAVARIAQIYAIEKDVRGTSADERRAARQIRSRPLTDALKIFFEHQLTRLAGGSDAARIIRYGLRHWDGLTRFLDDGRIELDTNIVERSMRPQALTRKNALFAGHDDGAKTWAILTTLIETAKLNSIEPHAWLADILTRLVNLWPNNRLDELLPWAWTAARRQKPIGAAQRHFSAVTTGGTSRRRLRFGDENHRVRVTTDGNSFRWSERFAVMRVEGSPRPLGRLHIRHALYPLLLIHLRDSRVCLGPKAITAL